MCYVCLHRNTLKDRPWWTWCVSTSTCWRRTTLVWPLPTRTPRRSVNCVLQKTFWDISVHKHVAHRTISIPLTCWLGWLSQGCTIHHSKMNGKMEISMLSLGLDKRQLKNLCSRRKDEKMSHLAFVKCTYEIYSDKYFWEWELLKRPKQSHWSN